MTLSLLFASPGNDATTTALAAALPGEIGQAIVRRFPDGESHVQLLSQVEAREVVIVCSLARPDDKLVPLLLLAAAAREYGAARVGLVAPYLAYMRQDAVFHAGEIVSARHFAKLLGSGFDWLLTVDPHLHRIHDLAQLYAIPTRVVHAADSIAAWLRVHVARPALIGPDEESRQWVQDIAQRIGAPYTVVAKRRHGDRDVEVTLPDAPTLRGHTPVLVDDIVSTGSTMIATLAHLHRAGLPPPVCIAVHALFAGGAYESLRAAGVADIVSCDTVSHASNRISLATALADAISAITSHAP